MGKRLLVVLIMLLGAAGAQVSSHTAFRIRFGAALPATCSPNTGDVFFKTAATIGAYQCLVANTWTAMGGSAFASGGLTANVIPKSNGAGQLVDGVCTDGASAVVCTNPIQTPNGASGANGLQLGAATNGLYVSGSSIIAQQNSTDRFSWGGFVGAGTNFALGIGFAPNLGSVLDSWITRPAANMIQLGKADANGVPLDQTLLVQNAITGSNLAPGHFTVDAPKGTGNGAGSKTCFNRALMGATGTTSQPSTNGFCLAESKTLSNTSATATALVNISVPSNSSGGSSGTINVSCNDGTNFDSETNTFFVSYVNKASALTIGTVQLGTPSTANNSGSCTTAITATAGTNSVDIKVTPVITTIVPTTTTGTVLSLSSYATGNVTVN